MNEFSMKPWPALADKAFYLKLGSEEGIFYFDTGPPAAGPSSAPAFVLIHGLGDEADTWRHVFAQIAAAGYRVIAPDLPGFGRSVWKGKISIRVHRKAILRLLAETGAASADNPAALIGSSLGAGIAQLAAARRPDLVKSLVLIGGCVPLAGKVEKGMLLMGFFGRRWYRAFRANHEGAWKSLYPYYGDLDAMSAEDREFLRQRVIARVESDNQERGYFSSLRSTNAFFLFGMRAAAQKIKTFTGNILLIWGERDNIVPQQKTALFRSLRPDARFALIPGAGHLPHQEKPAETAAEMLRFLPEAT